MCCLRSFAGDCRRLSKPAKVTQQEAAIAAETTEQVNASAAAVARSRYRTYRWMTDEEMVRYRLGYDPTMDAGTRYAVEQAVDDDLADKGFRHGEPADFVVAFSDVYIDRNRSAPGSAFEGPGIEATEGVSGSQMEAYNDMEIYRTRRKRSPSSSSMRGRAACCGAAGDASTSAAKAVSRVTRRSKRPCTTRSTTCRCRSRLKPIASNDEGGDPTGT